MLDRASSLLNRARTQLTYAGHAQVELQKGFTQRARALEKTARLELESVAPEGGSIPVALLTMRRELRQLDEDIRGLEMIVERREAALKTAHPSFR